jgi:hypothetical protein
MEILNRQKLVMTSLYPFHFCQGLTLWTMPIPAGVVGKIHVITVIALDFVTTQGFRSTAFNMMGHFDLLRVRRAFKKLSQNIRHLGIFSTR